MASSGGYVRQYQVDVNPDTLKAFKIGIDQVKMAVKNSNRDIGGKTIEVNKVEYFIRGLGYIKTTQDLENAVVNVSNNKPVLIKDIANVSLGPATRRGVLDKGGAEVVGGVVVARYGSNPLEVNNNLKAKKSSVQLLKLANNTNKSLFKGEAYTVWMALQKEIKSELQHVEHFSNLEDVRKEYLHLSNTMIEIVHSFHPNHKSLYVIQCSMANKAVGADWLNNSKDVKNPFYGKTMLT